MQMKCEDTVNVRIKNFTEVKNRLNQKIKIFRVVLFIVNNQMWARNTMPKFNKKWKNQDFYTRQCRQIGEEG